MVTGSGICCFLRSVGVTAVQTPPRRGNHLHLRVCKWPLVWFGKVCYIYIAYGEVLHGMVCYIYIYIGYGEVLHGKVCYIYIAYGEVIHGMVCHIYGMVSG